MTGHELVTAKAAREVVWSRQMGVCLACDGGMHPDEMHLHHRLRRRDARMAGGEWCPCLLAGLHPSCHVVAPESVHQRVAWARERGLIVPSWDDPRVVPVVTFMGQMILQCDGDWRFHHDEEAAPA